MCVCCYVKFVQYIWWERAYWSRTSHYPRYLGIEIFETSSRLVCTACLSLLTRSMQQVIGEVEFHFKITAVCQRLDRTLRVKILGKWSGRRLYVSSFMTLLLILLPKPKNKLLEQSDQLSLSLTYIRHLSVTRVVSPVVMFPPCDHAQTVTIGVLMPPVANSHMASDDAIPCPHLVLKMTSYPDMIRLVILPACWWRNVYSNEGKKLCCSCRKRLQCMVHKSVSWVIYVKGVR